MGFNPPIQFCAQCGGPLQIRVVEGKKRPYCGRCDRIYFPDLKVAVAVIVEQDEKILLVKRGIEPHQGLWTLPAGFMDAGEDAQRAAERECLEETGLHVSAGDLVTIISGQEHSRGAHLVIVYKAEVVGGNLNASDDALEAAFFGPDNLPPLAFEATVKSVEIWLGHEMA